MIATLILLGLKSLLVAAVALGALRLTRGRSAAERSTIAHLGLFALIALPLASLALPSLELELPSPLAQQLALDGPSSASDFSAFVDLPKGAAPPADDAAPNITDTAQGPAVAPPPALASLAAPLARIAYMLPAMALLALTAIALIRLVALRARAQVLVDPVWVGALARAQRRMGFKNGTALLTSADLQSPISWGLLRPTIVVNDGALAADSQAEAVIAHELAHIIQLDWAKLMLARVATAVFWFNPLAWALAREAHQLREEAADDAVLAANIAGPDYAALLVGIARHGNGGLLLGAHGVAPARNSLHRRVARVLDTASARGPSGRSWVAGFTAGMMVMAAPLAALTLGPAQAGSVVVEPAVPSLPAVDAAPRMTAAPAVGPLAPATSALASTALAPAARHHAKAAAPGSEAAQLPMSMELDITPPDLNSLSASVADLAELGTQFGEQFGAQFSKAFGERYARAGQRFAAAAKAAVPVPHAAPQPRYFGHDGDDDSDADDDTNHDSDAMVGVTEAYRKDIAAAGFPDARRGDLLRARSVWLDGDTIRALRAAGIDGPLSTFVQVRSVGLNAEYLKAMRAGGMVGSAQDFVRARGVGLTPDYVRGMREAGIAGSLNDYIQAKATGLSVAYVSGLKALGVSGSFKDYWELRAAGVSTGFVTSLVQQGYDVRSPAKLIEMRMLGYQRRPRQSDGG